jgi:hypothetical protein
MILVVVQSVQIVQEINFLFQTVLLISGEFLN